MIIARPKLTSSLQVLDIKEALMKDNYISNGRVTTFDLEEIEDKVVFDQIHFDHISMNGIQFDRVEFIDCVFEKCDLSNVDFGDAIFHRVEISGSKLLGTNISQSRLTDVKIEESIANYLNMSFSKLKKVAFKEVKLNRADFIEAVFEKVSYEKCELDGANFTETALKNIDLSSNTYEQLTVSLEKLADCTVSTEQAIGFAKSLGLKIIE